MPAIRTVVAVEGNKITINGQIDDYDDENGTNDRIECARCAKVVSLPDDVDFEFI